MRVAHADVADQQLTRGLSALALVVLASACASATAGVATAPGGMVTTVQQASAARASTAAPMAQQNVAPALQGVGPAEAALRQAIAAGDSAQAVLAVDGLPKDELLRLLHLGLVRHRAGAFAASNKALQQAEALAEARYVKSLTQSLGAATINENIADYVPPAHERAFIHYYGMLNYLRLGNLQDALVEARKANQFLERYARENGGRTFTTDAAVEYLAGVLHLMGNDQNDAFVSFQKSMGAFEAYNARYGVAPPRLVGVDATRVATRMSNTDMAKDISDRFELSAAESRPQAGAGELLVLIENGFIAHRVQTKLHVSILGSEEQALTNGGLAAALLVGVPTVDRILTLFKEANAGNEYAQSYEDGYVVGALVTGGTVISAAWPRYELQGSAVDEVTVNIGMQRQAALVMDDLAAIAARSFEEEKAGIMRRAFFRAMGKYAIAKFAEAKAEKAAGGGLSFGGIVAGAVAKGVVQGVANATEVADTRSWSTLPAEIRAARFSLAPGDHNVTLTVRDGDGSTRTIELGRVNILAGKVTVKSAFVTGTSRGAVARFEKAKKGQDVAATATVATGVPLPAVLPTPASSARGSSVPLPATIASVMAVRPLAASFKPLTNETMSFAVQMRGTPQSDQRARAELSAYITKQGSGDTALVWNGGEGDTLTWGGKIGNATATAGVYTWILRTTTPRGDRPTQYTWSTAVDVEAPNGGALTSEPSEPDYVSETKTIREPDYRKKHRMVKKGVIWSVVGSVFTTVGYSLAVESVASTPPGNSARSTALAVWGSGAAIIGIGSLMFTSGMLGSFPHDVKVPDNNAKLANQDAKEAHARALAAVRDKNERIKNSVVMRVRPVAGSRP